MSPGDQSLRGPLGFERAEALGRGAEREGQVVARGRLDLVLG